MTKIGSVTINRSTPRIIASLCGRTLPELRATLKKLNRSQTDIIEWRVDGFETLTAEALVPTFQTLKKLAVKPLLVTLRTQKEGGVASLTDGAYRDLALALIQSNVDAIDIEFQRKTSSCLLEAAKKKGITTVVSYHNFASTPTEKRIKEKLLVMSQTQADILKIALMPKTMEDVFSVISAARWATKNLSQPIIAISMGEKGILTRLACKSFGGCATFASLAEKTSAPGQITIQTTNLFLDFLK